MEYGNQQMIRTLVTDFTEQDRHPSNHSWTQAKHCKAFRKQLNGNQDPDSSQRDALTVHKAGQETATREGGISSPDAWSGTTALSPCKN